MSKTVNVLIVGVGGQGIVLAGEILAQAALEDGLDVKKSEIHGMSQRGGSVTSHVRFGERVFSPVIPAGQTDLLLAFELLEGLRYATHARRQGLILLNTQKILPAPVLAGAAEYPEDVEAKLRENSFRVVAVNGLELAKQAGHPLTVNVALLGAASVHLPLSDEAWQKALERHVKPNFLEVNKKAFLLGKEAGFTELT